MKLKELRAKTKLNQKEFAKIFGLTQGTYSNYENGTTQPDLQILKKIADYFHTTVDNIIDHEVPYLLDKSTLTPEQREIVELVPQMNYEECKLLLAYLAGIRKGIEERNEKFKKEGKYE